MDRQLLVLVFCFICLKFLKFNITVTFLFLHLTSCLISANSDLCPERLLSESSE